MSMNYIEANNIVLDIPVVDAARSIRTSLINQFAGGIIKNNKSGVSVRALDDVSLSLGKGDRVALIGHNGSGKTTLLRTLAGIYKPTTGAVTSHGRIISIFDPSVGLNVERTGRANIKTIAYFLGMSPSALAEHIDGIIDFCELGEFIDLPVRIYSAGMTVRLGFAVATALNPDILLLDEGIGAGDAKFAERARERLENFYSGIKCMVLASHSEDLLRSLCNKALLLEHGKAVMFGGVDEVLQRYHESNSQQ